MKIKKEYVILLAIIIGAGLYLYVHDTDRLNYELPTPAPLSRADIAKIEISLPQEGQKNKTERAPLVLEKKTGQWHVNPGNYRADDVQVQPMLTAAIDLSLTTLVSTTKDYIRYGLSPEDAISVRFSDKDGNVLRQFDLGKKTTTNNHTFIKLNDDPKVYHAIGRLPKDFDKTVAELRDKTVLSFDRQDIDKITIVHNDTTMVLEKRPDTYPDTSEDKATSTTDVAAEAVTKEAAPPQKPSMWIIAQGEDAPTKNANDDEINDFLLDLDSLNCTAFLPGEKTAELNDHTPVYSITLVSAAGNHTLDLFAGETDETSEGEKDFLGISSYAESPFVLAKARAEGIIKNQADFISSKPMP